VTIESGLKADAKKTSLATGTGIFAIYFMISSMTLAAPVIAGSYSLPATITGFIIQAHLIGTVLVLLPAAKAGDIIGHGRILYLGGFFFAASSFLCATADPGSTGGFELIFFRFTQGIGDGMIMASSLVLLSRWWKKEQRGESFGIFLFAGYMGYISGLLGGGWLIDTFGWKAPFLAVAPLTLITGISGYMLFGHESLKIERTGEKFDFKGMILFGPGIILIVAGLSHIPSIVSVYLIFAGITAFLILVFHERKIDNPLFDTGLFKSNRFFSLAILSDVLYYAGIGAISYLICIYLEAVRNYDSFHSALIILPVSLVQCFASPVAGKLSDRIRPGIISGAGLGLIILTLVFFSSLNIETEILLLSIFAAFTGAGFALFSAPNKNAIMSSVEMKNHGNASGLANTFEQTGNLLSIGIAVSILTFVAGGTTNHSASIGALLNSIDIVFFVLAIICLINIAIIYIRCRFGGKKGV